MKQNFSTSLASMTSFFRRTLFFVLLFGGVCNVWGTEYSLSFIYTQVGSEDPSTNICSYYDKDKIILDSDFGWNKGKDDVCNRSNGGEIDGWMMCKNAAKACSRSTYSFDATTVTVTLKVKCKDNGTYTGPTVKIKDTYSCSFGSITFNNGYEEKTLNNSITVTQAGTYDISVEFAGSDKFYVQDIKLSFTASPTVTYSVTYDANSATSGSVPTDNTAYTSGQTVTVKGNTGSLVRTNYEFAGWNNNAEGTGTTYSAVAPLGTFEISDNTTLYAKWKATVVQYDVKYYDGSDVLGTEKVASGDTPKNYGNYQTKANHDFVNWYNESNWQSVANFSTAITANKDFYGKWTEKAKYAITVEVASSCAGQGTVNGSGEYYQGAEITISATPATGYSFLRWNDNNTSASRQITVSEAKTYTAYFENKVNALIVTGTSTNKGEYIADWSKGDGGTIDIDNVNDSKFGHQVLKFTYEMPNSGSYAGITVPKDDGYSSSSSADATGFGFWYKTESSSDNVAFVLDADEGANDGANQMKMLLTGTNGTWQYKYCTSGLASQWNSSMRVWINKNINDVGQTANESGNIYISEIRATEIIQITYALTLSSSNPTYGTVACTSHSSTMSAIPSGASVTVEATETAGSFVRWVDENDIELSTSSQYTFTMTGHKTVTGVFSAPVQKYTVSATMGEHGASVSGTGDYAEYASVTLEAKADENYSFKNWSNVSGVELTSEQLTQNPLTFTMPANAVSVKANFEFEAVENIIATGTSANAGSNDLGKRDGSYSWKGTDDPQNIFENDVLEISYSMNDTTTNDQSYAGHNLVPDDGYAVDSKATGIAFWYMTEKSDDQVYMEIKASGTQLTFKLPATNGVWTYKYQETGSAKTATYFELWVNGKKDNFAMRYNSGKFYLAEIQATNVTERDPKSSCGTCFPVDFSK